MNNQFKIGFTACYINDFKVFRHLGELPEETAVAWVQHVCPNVLMGSKVKAKSLTVGMSNDTDASRNGWLNKLFIIVGESRGKWVALYNHDGEFSIRIEKD